MVVAPGNSASSWARDWTKGASPASVSTYAKAQQTLRPGPPGRSLLPLDEQRHPIVRAASDASGGEVDGVTVSQVRGLGEGVRVDHGAHRGRDPGRCTGCSPPVRPAPTRSPPVPDVPATHGGPGLNCDGVEHISHRMVAEAEMVDAGSDGRLTVQVATVLVIQDLLECLHRVGFFIGSPTYLSRARIQVSISMTTSSALRLKGPNGLTAVKPRRLLVINARGPPREDAGVPPRELSGRHTGCFVLGSQVPDVAATAGASPAAASRTGALPIVASPTGASSAGADVTWVLASMEATISAIASWIGTPLRCDPSR